MGSVNNFLLVILMVFAASITGMAQQQSDPVASEINDKAKTIVPIRDSASIADSTRRARARRATKHSAMLPGWGQFDNRQPWKTPVIYGALGFTSYLFFYNLTEYKALRQAYIYRTDTIASNDDNIPEKYQPLSNNSIRFYRDEFRKNVDYSVLAFLIIWGLNVVDASVFANLRDFNVSDDLSLRIKTPAYNLNNKTGQVGLALQLKPPHREPKPLPGR